MIKKLKKIPNFLKETKEELKKVSWSSREEVVGSAIVVVITLTFLIVYISLIDLGLSKLVEFLLQ